MSTYVVGDLQGCASGLARLLKTLRFDRRHDRLLLTGDLVARGPDSLETLRMVQALGPAARTVLGNHDLHLLALWRGHARKPAGPDLAPILTAPDGERLLDWLRRQPLALRDAASGTLLIHAGLAPQWTQRDALRLAAEVQTVLRDDRRLDAFLPRMYGNEPAIWRESLRGADRLRCIVNILTRARYCTAEGRFEFSQKGAPGTQGPGWQPWFLAPDRRSRRSRIAFGHWSTLGRVAWPEAGVHGLDTGYVWGGRLTALCLENGRLHAVAAPR
ncbi:MAG TPA: symmetrical bis(5'-nucleosyl)-tetraphosphatase [Solimonas sp.]